MMRTDMSTNTDNNEYVTAQECAPKATVYCGCTDPGCPCEGKCKHRAIDCAHRIDMEDRTGTPVCARCREDMMDCGLFTFKPWNLRFHRA